MLNSKSLKQLFYKLEKKTILKMIQIYCDHHHSNNLCKDCSELDAYAQQKLLKCPYEEDKPVCSNCKIHCYQKEKQEHIREVMRFSGPKMLYKAPILTIFHLIKKYTKF